MCDWTTAGWKSLRHPPNVPPNSHRCLSCYTIEKDVQISSCMPHVAEPSRPLPMFSEGAALWELRNIDPRKQNGPRKKKMMGLTLLRDRAKWIKHPGLKTSSKSCWQFWQQRLLREERGALPAHFKYGPWWCSLAAVRSNSSSERCS